MFVGQASILPYSVDRFHVLSSGRLWSCSKMLILCWRCFPGTNALAYNEHSDVKCFIKLGAGASLLLAKAPCLVFLGLKTFLDRNTLAYLSRTLVTDKKVL
jgi:hypothetical protein